MLLFTQSMQVATTLPSGRVVSRMRIVSYGCPFGQAPKAFHISTPRLHWIRWKGFTQFFTPQMGITCLPFSNSPHHLRQAQRAGRMVLPPGSATSDTSRLKRNLVHSQQPFSILTSRMNRPSTTSSNVSLLSVRFVLRSDPLAHRLAGTCSATAPQGDNACILRCLNSKSLNHL